MKGLESPELIGALFSGGDNTEREQTKKESTKSNEAIVKANQNTRWVLGMVVVEVGRLN